MAEGAKYAIRVALLWLVPVILFFTHVLILPVALSLGLTVLEVPQLRKRVLGSGARKHLPCFRVNMLIRLLALWMLQVWWVILIRATDMDISEDARSVEKQHAENTTLYIGSLMSSISVVLPCAGEGDYALKTVQSVFDSTPDVLREIIIVDDGSDPPLNQLITEEICERYKVKLIRHESQTGLIAAKLHGGNLATGDIVVFFDCHVAPQPNWHIPFLQLISENNRRIVVPVITSLDVSTWTQLGTAGVAKCYLTWDADFKWFESDDDFIPVISGGLLGISKMWWNETGGYDEEMRGWGGENLDQSLRSWLCGGEIVLARNSFVAHMWRQPSDRRTRANYQVDKGDIVRNRMRAASAWFGDFKKKLSDFGLQADGWGDTNNMLNVKQRLQCKSFAWFMHRFRNVYEDGGLLPAETFRLRETRNNMCLTYQGKAGTSASGQGKVAMMPCGSDDHRQRWHGANRLDGWSPDSRCCSGLRAWNTDQCLIAKANSISTTVCDISGRSKTQAFHFTETGMLMTEQSTFMSKNCIQAMTRGLQVGNCIPAAWAKDDTTVPIETRLYREAIDRESEAMDEP